MKLVPNVLETVPLITVEQARLKAKQYRESRSIYTDLAWQINQQAIAGGHVVNFSCLREAPGLDEAISKLQAAGFDAVSTRDSNYNHLLCVKITW